MGNPRQPPEERVGDAAENPGRPEPIGHVGSDEPVETGLAKGHGRERDEDLVAGEDGVSASTTHVGGDEQPVEPAVEPGTLEQLGAFGNRRLTLPPVDDHPSLVDEVAEAVVVEEPLERLVHVAQIGLAREVGVLPLAAASRQVEVGGGQIPPRYGWIECIGVDRHAAEAIGNFPICLGAAESVAVAGLARDSTSLEEDRRCQQNQSRRQGSPSHITGYRHRW